MGVILCIAVVATIGLVFFNNYALGWPRLKDPSYLGDRYFAI